jgi:hypothetical protein
VVVVVCIYDDIQERLDGQTMAVQYVFLHCLILLPSAGTTEGFVDANSPFVSSKFSRHAVYRPHSFFSTYKSYST